MAFLLQYFLLQGTFSLIELMAVALARTPSFHCAWSDWLVIHMHKHKAHTMQLCCKS
jgi:hypothetical protein